MSPLKTTDINPQFIRPATHLDDADLQIEKQKLLQILEQANLEIREITQKDKDIKQASEQGNLGISQSNQSRYEVTIKPHQQVFIKNETNCYLQSGMEGEVNIVTLEETFMEFLLRKARLMANV